MGKIKNRDRRVAYFVLCIWFYNAIRYRPTFKGIPYDSLEFQSLEDTINLSKNPSYSN